MDTIESQLKSLLNGTGIESEDFCDFSLCEQNEQLASKGILPQGPTQFTPLTKKTVTYIVASVIVNEENQVLMIQEAKPSCSGQWYLPAGRMEPGERINDAAKREVLEETGLDFEPTTLLMVESASGCWFRFVMTGIVLGGKLKTTNEADEESLQAKWMKDFEKLNLRSKDILPIIQLGMEYHTNRDEPWHSKILPSIISHKKMYLRIVVAVRRKANNKVNVLVSEKVQAHLPLCEINPNRSIHTTLKKYLNEIFGPELPKHKPHGVLCVEYAGSTAGQTDGMCLTILVTIRDPLEEIHLIDKYSWKELSNGELGEQLLSRIANHMILPLHVIR